MHYGVYVPNFGPYGDARVLADLDALVRGLAHVAVVCPLGELDADDEAWL